jgi:hypothetical protein
MKKYKSPRAVRGLCTIATLLALLSGLPFTVPAHADSQFRLDPVNFPGSPVHLTEAQRYMRLTPEAAGAGGAGSGAASNEDSWLAYPFRARPQTEPDWKGAALDAAYFLGYQVAGVAILYALPESFSNWSEDAKTDVNFRSWWENVNNPTTEDTDDWYINWALHPWWGATYHVRARQRGLDGWQAFGYSTFMSALWEYGAEAFFERPSVLDLIVTPVLGSLLGEFLFMPLREHIQSKQGALDWSDKFLLLFTDPLGGLNAEVDRVFGVKPTYQLMPVAMLRPTVPSLQVDQSDAGFNNRQLTGEVRPVLGMQFRMTW